MVRQPGLFDLDERYRKLSEIGDPLNRLKELVDFEAFLPSSGKGAEAFRRIEGMDAPPYDADVTEFQIRDRISFIRFLGLELQDAAPNPRLSGY